MAVRARPRSLERLSLDEVADELRCSRRRVERLIADPDPVLRSFRDGGRRWVLRGDLERYASGVATC